MFASYRSGKRRADERRYTVQNGGIAWEHRNESSVVRLALFLALEFLYRKETGE